MRIKRMMITYQNQVQNPKVNLKIKCHDSTCIMRLITKVATCHRCKTPLDLHHSIHRNCWSCLWARIWWHSIGNLRCRFYFPAIDSNVAAFYWHTENRLHFLNHFPACSFRGILVLSAVIWLTVPLLRWHAAAVALWPTWLSNFAVDLGPWLELV